MAPPILAYIAVALTGISMVQQQQAASDASAAAAQSAQAQREANAAKARQSEVEAQRQRISQVREARIRQAQIMAQTTSLGAGTSGISGAVGSIESQKAANIGSINVTQGFTQQISAANQREADANSRYREAQATGQQWQTIQTIFGANKADFTTVFGAKTAKGTP